MTIWFTIKGICWNPNLIAFFIQTTRHWFRGLINLFKTQYDKPSNEIIEPANLSSSSNKKRSSNILMGVSKYVSHCHSEINLDTCLLKNCFNLTKKVISATKLQVNNSFYCIKNISMTRSSGNLQMFQS